MPVNTLVPLVHTRIAWRPEQFNRCTNPGFETDTTGWSVAAGINSAGTSITRITTDSHSGSACGSLVTTSTAGSGFYAPTLFDRYADFTLTPAAMFAMPVVRRPSGGVATLLGGGYHASGPAGHDRLPAPHLPSGLLLDPLEGAGEVQTPVIGAAAASLRVGDRVYLRHAKAGELCERFDKLYLIVGPRIVAEVPTYRGDGRCEL